MITFNQDLWIKNGYIIKDMPNLYWAYVWKEDLKDINYRRRIPWIKVNKEEIIKYLALISNNQRKSLKELAKNIEAYTQLNYKSKKDFVIALEGAIENSVIDFVTLRVLCLMISGNKNKSGINLFFKLVSKADYITDYSNLGRFKPPLSKKELLNKDVIYLAGCQAGDGYLSPKYLATITDGHKNKKYLAYSRKHILDISKKINRVFNTNSFIYNKGGFYCVCIKNKWYVRHLNKFFNLPIGNKKNKLKEPDILKSIKERSKFWQGVFDSDGNAKNITIELTHSLEFLNELKSLLKEIDVDYISSKKFFRERITIKKKDLIKFSDHIGFDHPRKKRELELIISKGTKFRVLKGLKTNSLTKEGFYNLLLVKNLMVHGYGRILKKYKDKTKISYYQIANICGLSHSTIITAFQNKNSLALKKIARFYDYLGLGQDRLYRDLKKHPNIRFRSCRGSTLIRLPLLPNKEILKILRDLRPQDKRKITYITTDNRKEKVEEKLDGISKIFKARVSKDKHRNLLIYSIVLHNFLITFYRYEKPW